MSCSCCSHARRPACGDPDCKGCKNRLRDAPKDKTIPEEYDWYTKEVVQLTRQWQRGSLALPTWGSFFDEVDDEIETWWDDDMPEFPSPDKAKKEARENSEKVFAAYDTLNKILERHEEIIQKRWMKKTRQQRLQILLKAWPDMPAPHRPDFKAFELEHQDTRSSKYGSKYKDWFMWPLINQEDLLQSKMMLLFMNSRGRNPPASFAAADWEAMHVGQVTEGLSPPYLHGYTMILNGATTAGEYGKIVKWDSYKEEHWIYDGIQFWPGEGLLILKAQARILEFLVHCCHQILHEIPPDTMTSSAYPVQPEASLKTGTDESGHTSMAALALEAPYKVPTDLNLDRIASLLEAQMSAMEDHIWAMREDPAYFAEQLLEKRDHSMESMLDSNGKPHPLTHKLHEPKLWAKLVTQMSTESFWKLETMTLLHREARKLSALHKEYENQFKPTEELPEAFRTALYRFRFYLRKACKDPLVTLKVEFEASPPMRWHYVRDPPGTAHCGGDTCSIIPAEIFVQGHHNLFFLVDMLYQDEESWARQSLLVDELERLLRSEPEADKLISSYVMGKIGYLSVLSHCTKQLELHQPWARHYSNQIMWGSDRTHDFTDDHERELAAVREMVTAIQRGKSLDKLGRLADPSGGKFAYPYGKRRNRDTVNALRQAEANLDAVWAEIDRIIKNNMTQFENLALYKLLSQPRSLRRTPEWVEPEQTKEKKQPGAEKGLWFLNRPLSNLFLGESEQPGQKIETVASKKKTKSKTKGEPAKVPIEEVPPVEAPEPEPVDKQPTFAVDARALKVFRMLFFNPEVTSSPGTVPWNNFLHAMASTGFQMEKLYGSVWQFQPTGLDVERGIHFHEPHPKGKIPFEIARRHGRRLARTYGWNGGMFVLKGK